MNNILKFLSGILKYTSLCFASLAVNSTCIWKYYQEELDEQTNSLKKYEK